MVEVVRVVVLVPVPNVQATVEVVPALPPSQVPRLSGPGHPHGGVQFATSDHELPSQKKLQLDVPQAVVVLVTVVVLVKLVVVVLHTTLAIEQLSSPSNNGVSHAHDGPQSLEISQWSVTQTRIQLSWQPPSVVVEPRSVVVPPPAVVVPPPRVVPPPPPPSFGGLQLVLIFRPQKPGTDGGSQPHPMPDDTQPMDSACHPSPSDTHRQSPLQ